MHNSSFVQELSSQFPLHSIHLAAVGLMIVAAQMQNAMNDQLAHLAFERVPRSLGLKSCGLDRDHDIAQIVGVLKAQGSAVTIRIVRRE